ncbi:hypothetical protein M0804_007533 [Polistes exclamans]|nr:hypothetical protein M0804_007533 [Polistes exclamans]
MNQQQSSHFGLLFSGTITKVKPTWARLVTWMGDPSEETKEENHEVSTNGLPIVRGLEPHLEQGSME